jgi:serine acetyltransferase
MFYVAWLRELLNVILHLMARVLPGGADLRPFLHRLRGVKIHGEVWIGEDVYLNQDYPETLEIHDGAMIATRCTVISHAKGPGRIIIGKQAAIGAGCVIVCACGQTLTIGEGAVISAGSTVSHDIPPYTLCGAPRIQAFGKVTVPFTVATTFEEFRRGLKPIRSKNGQGERFSRART